MGIHNKELVANKPVRWELAVEPEVETLPEVPAAVLRRAFQHLSPRERDGALRQRLVPVAWLPNITLYADGNEATRTQQTSTRKKSSHGSHQRRLRPLCDAGWGLYSHSVPVMDLSKVTPTFRLVKDFLLSRSFGRGVYWLA